MRFSAWSEGSLSSSCLLYLSSTSITGAGGQGAIHWQQALPCRRQGTSGRELIVSYSLYLPQVLFLVLEAKQRPIYNRRFLTSARVVRLRLVWRIEHLSELHRFRGENGAGFRSLEHACTLNCFTL